ncbi:MAG: 3-keto-5-aminohexanoate cleavage protein [Rhizobiales bacterium]|nr:3-keto-5-aminohexanoate cleavage protein [Hyphomicrobiales bacterium]
MTPLRDKYEASVLTAAITGGDVLPSQSPYIPCGAEAIVAEAVAAAAAGATCVHVHARDDDGRPSADPDLFARIVDGIRERSDVVVNVSTGGAPGMSVEERLAGVRRVRPEIATFNLGTMNYEGFPNRERWPEVGSDWERAVLETSGDGTFVNTLSTLREFAATLRELGVTPELEAYDLATGAMHAIPFDTTGPRDARAEMAYLFDHQWRFVEAKFYDAGMHGVDWPRMRDLYARQLPHISHWEDFAELMAELQGELNAKGRNVPYERILAEILERDERDSHRSAAPLRQADDAVRLDTTALDAEAAFAAAVAIVEAGHD